MDVSILIPVHNGLEYTRSCIESLHQTMPGQVQWELLIYDDQSTDGTGAYLGSLNGATRVFREAERGHYAWNNNRLAAEARGRWLLMLNNDTLCLPGWFEPMWNLAESAHGSEVGVIGGMQVFGDRRTISHAGVVFAPNRMPCHLYEGLSATLEPARTMRDLQAVTAACWLTRTDLFRRLDGFHEGYRNGYEDIDYCLRVREAGSRVLYAGQSCIVHFGGCSANRFDHEIANQRLFLKRNRKRIEVDLRSLTTADGVRWPGDSAMLHLLRRAWHSPVGRPMYPLVRNRQGLRLRRWVMQRLSTQEA